MPELLTPEIKARIGDANPTLHVEVTRRDIQKYAVSTGQTAKKYLDGDEAPPLFHFGYSLEVLPPEKLRKDGIAEDKLIPPLPLKRVMAGSSDTVYHRPIRAGDKLAITRRLKDIYEKAGKSGPLIFVVTEVVIETEGGEPVLNETTSLIAR
ncbi:MAG TPA: acyl dehydratase [Porticoccaceae bacterium]|jgi:3-methylfumaryl-CoA hydratase|nr:acyl dehydratase [Porticoccaceae bacterium]